MNDLADLALSDEKDGIKISISGTAGMTRCTNWIKYGLHQLWVLPDRDYYWDDRFEEPRFDREFFEEFKRPRAKGAVPFLKLNFKSEVVRRQESQRED